MLLLASWKLFKFHQKSITNFSGTQQNYIKFIKLENFKVILYINKPYKPKRILLKCVKIANLFVCFSAPGFSNYLNYLFYYEQIQTYYLPNRNYHRWY